jgi:hypothetical protein
MGLVLARLSCHNCGAPLEIDPQAPVARCPFCDTELALSHAERAGREVTVDEVDRLTVPFSVDRAAFERAWLAWLADGDLTPDDVIERALLQEHVGLLVPVYRFRGAWRTAWTATAGFDHTDEEVVWTESL